MLFNLNSGLTVFLKRHQYCGATMTPLAYTLRRWWFKCSERDFQRLGPWSPLPCQGGPWIVKQPTYDFIFCCQITFLLLPMVKYARSRPKLQITIVFFSLLLFILFMHPCKDCQDGFSAITSKGLKLHQKKCQSFLKHETAANKRRKATATAKNVRRTKLKGRKVRSGSATLGVGFCDNQ
jgi:hypothetical protein